jgi:lipopolysaccharide export system permease protein
MAEKGAMVETGEGARVVMFNGNRQAVDKETNKLSILYFDRYIFDLPNARAAIEDRHREPRERDLGELFNIGMADPDLAPKEHGKFIVEGHKRLLSPLAALAYTLVGLACLIAGGFSRRTQTRQVSLAIALMVALQGSALGLENLAAKNLAAVPLMYAHAVVPIMLGYFFMVRLQWRRRHAARPKPA